MLATMIGKHAHKLNFGLKPLLLITSIIAMAVPMTFGQARRSSMKAFPQAATQPTKLLTFDVVSVKGNESGEANSRMKMTPDGIQLLTEPYDIVAKVDAGDVPSFRNLTFDQVREMLQPVWWTVSSCPSTAR